jgi:hypothetical protein
MCDVEKDWHERPFRIFSIKVDKERDFSCCCIYAVFLVTTKLLRMFLHCNGDVVTSVSYEHLFGLYNWILKEILRIMSGSFYDFDGGKISK